MAREDRPPNLGRVMAQDAGIIRADGYGPIGKGGQQIKVRPPTPAAIAKPDNTAQAVPTAKAPVKK